MPVVKVSTKHPGGRWRTGRQFGPDDREVEVTDEELSRLLADPVLRIVTLSGGPLPGASAPDETPPKTGLTSESTEPPGAVVPAGGPGEQSQQPQKRR